MTHRLPAESGTYVLINHNKTTQTIRVGALGNVTIEVGFLIYVGSAFGPGGIRARVTRHIREDKALHWHIDYLRRYLLLEEVWLTTAAERQEHVWAERLTRKLEVAFPRFGASDCRCAAHLFFCATRPTTEMIGGNSTARGNESVRVWRPHKQARQIKRRNSLRV